MIWVKAHADNELMPVIELSDEEVAIIADTLARVDVEGQVGFYPSPVLDLFLL